jgi:hypothetical protein
MKKRNRNESAILCSITAVPRSRRIWYSPFFYCTFWFLIVGSRSWILNGFEDARGDAGVFALGRGFATSDPKGQQR